MKAFLYNVMQSHFLSKVGWGQIEQLSAAVPWQILFVSSVGDRKILKKKGGT